MWVRVAQRDQIGSWSFSLLLHGLLLSAIWPMLQHLPVSIQPEPFRWNVTLVESQRQTAAGEPVGDAPPASEFLQATTADEQNPAPPIPELPPLVQAPKPEITETIQSAIEVTPVTVAPTPAAVSPVEPETALPTSFMTEPMPVTQDAPVQRDAIEQPQTMVTTTLVQKEPSEPITTPREQEAPPASVSAVIEVALAPTWLRDPSPAPPAAVPPTASGQSSGPRADYSWLQRAVSRRLEELKRSSRPSLEDASKLKVLVKAVVSNTGELMEAEVVKSSGITRIDQEAVTLVQRAFPMPLDYAIDRPQIVMRIPISYSRD